MITNEAISLKIRDARHEMGYTQKQLAEKIGISRDTIKDCELGRQRVYAVVYLKTMAALKAFRSASHTQHKEIDT